MNVFSFSKLDGLYLPDDMVVTGRCQEIRVVGVELCGVDVRGVLQNGLISLAFLSVRGGNVPNFDGSVTPRRQKVTFGVPVQSVDRSTVRFVESPGEKAKLHLKMARVAKNQIPRKLYFGEASY